MSKPEIKQYLMKVYNLPVTKVNTFRKAGKIMKNPETNAKWRKKDWKKAFINLD